MIIGYQNLKQLKENKYFKTWIIKILINECNKIYKKKYKQIILFNKSVEKTAVIEIKDDMNNVDNKLDFENVLKNLTYEDKLLITLYYNSQFSIKEIAELLNSNVNTIKSKLLRVRKKIKEIYEEVADNE